VWWLTGRSKRWRQIVAISRSPNGGDLGLQFGDRAPDVRRELPPGRRRRCQGLQVEEAAHAVGVEPGDLAPQRALGHAGLLGAGGDRVAEQDDRPQDLVGCLRGRGPAGIVHPRAERAHPGGRTLGAGMAPIHPAGAVL
jgi:hypothetical protein